MVKFPAMDEEALAALEADQLKRRAKDSRRLSSKRNRFAARHVALLLLAVQVAVLGVATGILVSHSAGPHPPNDRAVRVALSAAHLAPASDRGECPRFPPKNGIRLPVVCYRLITFEAASDGSKRQLLTSVSQALTHSGWTFLCPLESVPSHTALSMTLPGTASAVLIAYNAREPILAVVYTVGPSDETPSC